jgi:CheY-like chemotaxis protein
MTKPDNVILIVDDDEDVRDSLRLVLEGEGCAVETVTNGLEALRYLRSHGAPCLVLLDLMMPIMNGWDFLVEKDADPTIAQVAVVVVTAAGEAQVRALAGNRQVLPKPLKVEDLLAAVKQQCAC